MKIFVASHQGMVGSAIVRRLLSMGHAPEELLLRSFSELDLTSQAAVREFFERERPERVFLVAARGGGIMARSRYPAEFVYRNLMIEANVVHEAWRTGVERLLLLLGSGCVYPRLAPQPMGEAALMSGPPDPGNEPCAVARIAGIKLCESYNRQYGTDCRSIIPANLYGPGDDYHPENGHVVPALLRRFHEAREGDAPYIILWGTGTPRREFLHVDDLAAACVHVMELERSLYGSSVEPMRIHLNAGCGEDMSIAELAASVARVTGYRGRIVFNPSMPDGPPVKLMDSSRLFSLGWRPRVPFEEGLRLAYEDFLAGGAGR